MFEGLDKLIKSLDNSSISNERKVILDVLVAFIQQKIEKKEPVNINFICTHNSRRSHLSQIWAQTMAYHFNINNVFCYSGGTEATALFPKVAETLMNQGFKIQTLSESTNPVYAIKYSQVAHPIIGFSKRFDDAFNPASQFAAVMTCSHADENCPFVTGAEQRIPITFEDPKLFDGTPQQSQKYEERSIQIATELNYVFSQIRL